MHCGLSFLETRWLKQKELSFEMHTWSELWWVRTISGIWWIAIFPEGERKCITYGCNWQISSQERGRFRCKERITRFRKQIIKMAFLALWFDECKCKVNCTIIRHGESGLCKGTLPLELHRLNRLLSASAHLLLSELLLLIETLSSCFRGQSPYFGVDLKPK